MYDWLLRSCMVCHEWCTAVSYWCFVVLLGYHRATTTAICSSLSSSLPSSFGANPILSRHPITLHPNSFLWIECRFYCCVSFNLNLKYIVDLLKSTITSHHITSHQYINELFSVYLLVHCFCYRIYYRICYRIRIRSTCTRPYIYYSTTVLVADQWLL
jgi:hypothetical protein